MQREFCDERSDNMRDVRRALASLWPEPTQSNGRGKSKANRWTTDADVFHMAKGNTDTIYECWLRTLLQVLDVLGGQGNPDAVLLNVPLLQTGLGCLSCHLHVAALRMR
jgi:hypothetical protein